MVNSSITQIKVFIAESTQHHPLFSALIVSEDAIHIAKVIGSTKIPIHHKLFFANLHLLNSVKRQSIEFRF